MSKNLRVFGIYYTETERGRKYTTEYSIFLQLDTELSGGYLLSYIQKQVIDKRLIEEFGIDKYLGWQTCQFEELSAVPTAPTAPGKKPATKSQTPKSQTPFSIE